MQRFLFATAFIYISIIGYLFPQSCLPEGITFSTQEQLDSFPINHPTCTEIEGFVHIEGNDIKDLSGLNGIEKIGGYLKFLNNDSLVSLSGLENLVEIGGSLIIGSTDVPGGGYNPVLISLSGLNNLEVVGQNLEVCRNHALPDFEGLESLRVIGNLIYCLKNASLSSFSGLNSLDSLGGSIIAGGNTSMHDFSGLEGLDRIYGSLILGDCFVSGGGYFGGNGLANYVGLHNIISVGGNLHICRSDRDHITGLEKIKYVGGKLRIDLNGNLVSLDGLDSLNYIGDGIEIGYNNDYYGAPCGNHSLADISALMGVISVGGGNIHIEDNPMLPSLRGLDNIDPETIGSLVVFRQNSLNIPGRLEWCSVKSICDYLEFNGANVQFGENGPPGCNSESEVEENCDDAGIDDSQHLITVELFPVPAIKTLNISLNGSEKINKILVHDQYGRELMRFDDHISSIDISGLHAGLYYITLTCERSPSRVVRKFLVM